MFCESNGAGRFYGAHLHEPRLPPVDVEQGYFDVHGGAGIQEDSPQDGQRLEGDRNASGRDREQPEDGWQREYSTRRSPILGNSASEIFFYLSEIFPYLSEGFSYDSKTNKL